MQPMLNLSFKKVSNKRGFTLVEMLIIAPIVILMIGIFISAIVNMTGDVLATRASNALAYNIQDALNRIESDVTLSGAFLATNNIPLASPQGYNNDATNFHNANSDSSIGNMLILNTYATTSNPLKSTRSLLYMANQPNLCSSAIVSQNQPVMLNTIYFVKNNTLWRRVIMPSNYATVGCVVPWQKPSCATISGTVCLTKDERLVDGIQPGGFSVSYYTTPSSTTANSIASDTAQTDSVRLAALQASSTVIVTINALSSVAGREQTQSGTIRVVSPNNNATVTSDIIWSSFSLQNNWVDYGSGYHSNGYRRTKDGVVTLKGLIRRSSGTMVGGEVLANLPIGYSPSERLIFQTSTNPNAASRVDVVPLPDGTSDIVAWGDAVWLSLDGINFLASDAPYNFTTLTTLNGWSFYGSPFSPPAYAIDASGRVHTKGLVAGGNAADGIPIVKLPAAAIPLGYNHIPADACNVSGLIGIDYLGNINAKGGCNSYLSLQTMFYPSSYTGWSGLVLQNSWISYGVDYSAPQYTKSSDGMVSLHGLIKSGTGATIANLPIGYRPAGRVLYSAVANGVYSRVDIDTDGNIYQISGTNNWLSLDGINFYAN